MKFLENYRYYKHTVCEICEINISTYIIDNVSKEFIKGKASNQRTILLRGNRYLKDKDMQVIIDKISRNIYRIDHMSNIEGLMGVEGYIARLYYQAINIFINKDFSFNTKTQLNY